MSATEDPQQESARGPQPGHDDHRKDTVNPADGPVPANPPVEPDEVARGREKLDRLVDS